MTTKEIKEVLRAGPYAWPGGYPLYFVTADGGVLSYESVLRNWPLVCDAVRRRDYNSGWMVVACMINWEDPQLFCDHSAERIESAYAEDKAEE